MNTRVDSPLVQAAPQSTASLPALNPKRGVAADEPLLTSELSGYVVGLYWITLVASVRFFLDPMLHGKAALLPFIFPIVASAMVGGLGPGLFATVLGAAAGLAFLKQGFQWSQIGRPDQVELLIFLVLGLAISGLVAQLRRSQTRTAKLLRKADERKDVFLAMLGHELRNPLAGISSAAQLLSHAGLDSARVPGMAQIINRQVRHMHRLVNDLLDVSRVLNGKIEIEIKTIDMNDVLRTAVEQVRALIDARDHTLTLALPEAPVLVSGDAVRLVQVVSNLLVNAARYTPSGGQLTLSLGADGDAATISVQDNGVGIAPELAVHVFDFFVQAKRSTDRVRGGLGLGLSLVRSITQAHGGEVTMHSAGLGHGCNVVVKLPQLQIAPQATPPEKLSAPGEAPANSLNLLVVDDNRDAGQTLAALLELYGHRVVLAHSAEEALEQAAIARFDAAILDIGLPGMNGYRLATCLHALPHFHQTKLIALTGYGTTTDKAQATAAGFDEHLVKPADFSLLLGMLQAITA